MPATITNHQNATLPIYQIVLNRLPFLENTSPNEQLISYFIYEIMSQLNVCFKLAEGDVGTESKYSVVQKSLIADLVSIYILVMKAGGTVGSSTTGNSKFISKTKAKSVEVEWDQFDVKLGGTLAMTPGDMQTFYKKQAIAKTLTIGCIIDICDDCSILIQQQAQASIQGFIVYPSDDCGCCGG